MMKILGNGRYEWLSVIGKWLLGEGNGRLTTAETGVLRCGKTAVLRSQLMVSSSFCV
ncbi:MAG: hypothetical protein R6X34_05035 [Chloroflexota bacterium]